MTFLVVTLWPLTTRARDCAACPVCGPGLPCADSSHPQGPRHPAEEWGRYLDAVPAQGIDRAQAGQFMGPVMCAAMWSVVFGSLQISRC